MSLPRSTMPTLTYSEAERVGVAIKRRWKSLSGKKKTPALQDEQWADIVQTVMRHAAEEIGARPEK